MLQEGKSYMYIFIMFPAVSTHATIANFFSCLAIDVN